MISAKNTVVFSGGDLSAPLQRENVEFNRLVMFWNGETPGQSYFVLRLRVRFPGGEWEPWMEWAKWGRNISSSTTSPRRGNYRMEVDTLLADTKCEAFELGVEAISDTQGQKPRLDMVGATFWNREEVMPEVKSEWTGEIQVPPRSQMIQPSPDRRVICSPTCLAMVFAYYGRDIATLDVAAGVFDYGPEIYGNWSFNTAFAGSVGLSAFVHRATGMGEVREWLAAGTPMIASIAYGKGELKGAPQEKSNGHLVVITGFTVRDGEEYVVTNDPAAPDAETVRRLYRRDEFERAWNHIVYILFSH